MLPVEFARQSEADRLTLVLVPGRRAIRVLWALLIPDNLSSAMAALAERENTPEANIGYWTDRAETHGDFGDVIGKWAVTRQLDAVVWTALGPKWKGNNGQVPTLEQALEFVSAWGRDSEAAEYIRRAPAQVDTDFRRRMVAELPWLKSEVT